MTIDIDLQLRKVAFLGKEENNDLKQWNQRVEWLIAIASMYISSLKAVGKPDYKLCINI